MSAAHPAANVAERVGDPSSAGEAANERTRGRSGVHDRLRRDTAELHARLEETMRLDARLDSEESYRILLERFFGVVTPMEAELSRFAWPPDLSFAARARAHHLAQDLVRLGHSAESLADLPRCRDLPTLPTRAGAFGRLYVLEGSALGGRIILRAVKERLGRDASSGAAYFAGYGPATGSMWSGFLASLERHVIRPKDVEEAVRGGLSTFAALDRWLGEAAPSLTRRPGS